jgi:dolichol-phosphate mannosyltransferase
MPGPAWLILPTYDEADNLAALVDRVRGVLAKAAPEGFRVLVIDDGSPDGTGAIADELAARHGDVDVLHRPRRTGLAGAYAAGFERALAAGAGYVLQMDADFSHRPEDLPRLLTRAREGVDVVLGSRYVTGGGVENWSRGRRLVSRGGCWYARAVLGVPVRDLTGGLKCFRAEALEGIGLTSVRSRGYAFQVEVTWRALGRGLRVEEIPIVFEERREGRSKMTRGIAVEAAWRVPVMRVRARGRLGRSVSGPGSRAATPGHYTL